MWGDNWRDPWRWFFLSCYISITAYLVALVGTIIQAFQAGWH